MRGQYSPFNSPWECRIGLTLQRSNLCITLVFAFQFPVGMSNRSYRAYVDPSAASLIDFQFPVGMSNRSYSQVSCVSNAITTLSIPRGNVEQVLHSGEKVTNTNQGGVPLSIPRGNVEQVLRYGTLREEIQKWIFQFPVGMSNRSYSQVSCVSNAITTLSIPRGNVEQVLHSGEKVTNTNQGGVPLSIPRGNVEQVLRYGTLREEIQKWIFQFPVGMSNRSYYEPGELPLLHSAMPFNSPWECRIGLTSIVQPA